MQPGRMGEASHLAIARRHFPPSPEVHVRVCAHTKDDVHFAIQKQRLDQFEIEKGFSIDQEEAVAMVLLVLPIKCSRFSFLIWDRTWALAFMLLFLVRKDVLATSTHLRQMGAPSAHSRSDFPDGVII